MIDNEEDRVRERDKKYKGRAVVVAQLAERLLPIPRIRGSNPVIGKILH